MVRIETLPISTTQWLMKFKVSYKESELKYLQGLG